jgi:hypothetical protein
MVGQTVQDGYVSLPAGAKAVYSAGGILDGWWQPDWLGSSRMYTKAATGL